jgi:DNA (cytosine-5)-methyltransferase 1
MASIPPTFISLFCGCGGLDLGFLKAGFRCLGAFDEDVTVVEVYKKNLGGPVAQFDLRKGIPASHCFKKVDVLVAGPPCQGFSTAGFNDPFDARNLLLGVPLAVARTLSPQFILIENVMGLLAERNRHHLLGHLEGLKSLGYRTEVVQCNASSFGVPQHRRRLLIFGWRDEWSGRVELPKTPGGTLGEALKGIAQLTHHHPQNLTERTSAGQIARKIRPGQKLSNVRGGDRSVHTWEIPSAFGATTKQEREVLVAIMQLRRQQRRRVDGDADPVSARRVGGFVGRPVASTLANLVGRGYVRRMGKFYDLCHTFNGKYYRLESHKPAPTIHTRFGDPRYFLHPTEHRGFTVREAARLQTFPDSFSFLGTERQQFKMIGNAVPPALSGVIANYLHDRIFGF